MWLGSRSGAMASRGILLLKHRMIWASSWPSSLSMSSSSQGSSSGEIIKGLFEEAHAPTPPESSLPPELDLNGGGAPYKTFRALMEERRAQAKRSLIVQVRNRESAEDLYQYCADALGKVAGMYFHRNPDNAAFSDFYLLEFEDPSSVEYAYEFCRHRRRDRHQMSSVPAYSPFLWLSEKTVMTPSATDSSSASAPVPVYLPVMQEASLTADEAISKAEKHEKLKDQIVEFYRLSSMSEVSSRLRFLACQQVELALSGMFPKAEVLPFGSSVNSFGTSASDLDMSICMDPLNGEESPSRLVFHAKGESSSNSRLQAQRYYDLVSGILQHILPGCQGVRNIRHARVPIVKYNQQLLRLECDLSLGTLSGHYMSELLYLYGELDPRVRPVVFVVRKWAREHGLIEDARPTSFFTNFTLTVLVLFFLQARHKMLPPFRDLINLARPQDHAKCDDGVDCTFLRDVGGLQHRLNALWDSPESPDAAQVLSDFFHFYAEFDFSRNSVCVITGESQPKRPGNTPSHFSQSWHLGAINPLEPHLNVSGNVQPHALDRFQEECRKSSKVMERILDEEGGSGAKLSHLLAGGGPFKLQIKLDSLMSDSPSEEIRTAQSRRQSQAVDSFMPPVNNGGRRRSTDQDSVPRYQEERRRREELRRTKVPKVKTFFKPKF